MTFETIKCMTTAHRGAAANTSRSFLGASAAAVAFGLVLLAGPSYAQTVAAADASILELVKVIGPLTDPTAYGGRSEDTFDLVLPSIPGYGFSGKPQGVGWNPDHIARAWAVLMERLGYKRYVAQGGDWGSVVADVMARQAPAGLLGIHVNMPATVPPDIAKVLQSGDPAPSGLSAEEKAAFEQMNALYKKGAGYAGMMVTRPQTLGYSLADSPAGLAAWFYDKFAD